MHTYIHTYIVPSRRELMMMLDRPTTTLASTGRPFKHHHQQQFAEYYSPAAPSIKNGRLILNFEWEKKREKRITYDSP
jgi:hypothetical protein